MKKILAFLSVLALLVSFGMAFSVTGEFGSKFAANNDSYMKLVFDSFTFRFSLDSIAPAPTDYMIAAITAPVVTNGVTNTITFVPAWAALNLGRYELTGFAVSDSLTLGIKFGVNGYGYHQAIAVTNASLYGLSGVSYTNLSDIGYMGLDLEPQFKFVLSDTMSISEKDFVIQYWSMNQKYSDSAGNTNDTAADNALPKIGIGAQLTMNLSDQLSLNPGVSFTLAEKDGHDTFPGNTNVYKDGTNTLQIYGNTTLTGENYKFKLAPYFKMDMVGINNITANTVTNTVTGSQMLVRVYLGEGKPTYDSDGSYSRGDGDGKFDKGDDKNLRNFKVSDQFTIQPYFGVETILSSALTAISGGGTNNFANNEMVLAIGANDVIYKIDDTYTIDAQALYAMDNRGTKNNANNVAGTNDMQTNITTMSFGGKLKIQIAPNAVIHAGTKFEGYTKVYDTKAFGNTNVVTINHSAFSDPTLELGGEVVVGDFKVKGVIKSQVLLSSASDSTNTAYTSPGGGGSILTSTQGFGTAFGDMQVIYFKDNGSFKLKFTTGTAEAAPVVGAEMNYKF